MPKEMMHCPRKTFAMCIDDSFDVEKACVILEYLSVMTMTYLFLCAALGSGLGISIALKLSISAAGKS